MAIATVTSAPTPVVAPKKFYLQHSADDYKYVNSLKFMLGGRMVSSSKEPSTIYQVITAAKASGCNAILTTDVRFLALLTPDNNKPSIDASAGSMFTFEDMEILVLLPLKQLFTVSYGSYVLNRILSKVTHPHLWFKETEFTFEEVSDESIERVLVELSLAAFLVIDIETPVHPDKLIIGDYGVTGIYWNEGSKEYSTRSYVVDMDSMQKVKFMRAVNALPAPKIGQNFKYDIAFMHHWNAPVYNWRFDTITMMHCWLAELPKDLAFMTLLMVRNAFNWKYKSGLTDRYERLKYNAIDTWATANVFLALIREMPDWAIRNYHMEFPVNFPSVLMEAQGIKVNQNNVNVAKKERDDKAAEKLASIRRMVANPHFNPGSPQQTKALLKVLGFKDIESADEKALDKCRFKSAFAARIIVAIIDYRAIKKEVTSYLHDGVNYRGRCYFSVNPHGTDTGRMACKKHQFSFGTTPSNRENIGLNMQTIPRGDDDDKFKFEYGVKYIFEGDSDDSVDGLVNENEDFLFGEADYEQAEARDVAYLSGDEALIKAVDSGKDFHSTNASSFFGIPYQEIYRDEDYYDQAGNFFAKGVINKALRNLAKRVNHGANYNMGAYVLIQTMGEDKVLEAQKLLKLPVFWSLEKVAEFLLNVYATTYPDVKGTWYDQIKLEIKTTGLLVGGSGWTRKCFGDPLKNKRDLNAYVAHKPQNLNAMTLNKAVMKVFYYALKNYDTFRLCLQIHDSILFQYKRGYAYHADAVKEMMLIPEEIRDARGKVRTLIVPSDVKHGERNWGMIKG